MSRLRKERMRRRWSLTKVTVLTGIGTSDLSQLERGLRPAFPGWRERLVRAFGISEDELFAGTPVITTVEGRNTSRTPADAETSSGNRPATKRTRKYL